MVRRMHFPFLAVLAVAGVVMAQADTTFVGVRARAKYDAYKVNLSGTWAASFALGGITILGVPAAIAAASSRFEQPAPLSRSAEDLVYCNEYTEVLRMRIKKVAMAGSFTGAFLSTVALTMIITVQSISVAMSSGSEY